MNELPGSHDLDKPIRVLLLDHHVLTRQGLRLLLEAQPDIQVIAESGTSQKGLELATSLCPDIILMELNLDGELNTDIVAELARDCSNARIILVTGIVGAVIVGIALTVARILVNLYQNLNF